MFSRKEETTQDKMIIAKSCPQTFGNLKNLFNNQTDSDCQLLFPKQQKKLFLHKIILKMNSDFFKTCFESNMSESREGVVNIEEEDDTLMTELVKSFYTGRIELPRENGVASMIVLAQKYQVNAVLPPLLEALMENLDEKVREQVPKQFIVYAEEMLKGDLYLNLSIEQWISLLNLIVHEGNFLKVFNAVLDWIQVDETNRAQYTLWLMSTIRKSSDRKVVASFQPVFCGSKAVLSNSNSRLKRGTSEGWDCGALGTQCDHFSIRLLDKCDNQMVGMASENIRKEGSNYTTCGWYLFCATGGLYSQSGDGKTYAQKCSDNGTVIDISLKDGCLSYSVNGVDKGVAFRGLADDLFPAFNIHDAQCEFEFC